MRRTKRAHAADPLDAAAQQLQAAVNAAWAAGVPSTEIARLTRNTRSAEQKTEAARALRAAVSGAARQGPAETVPAVDAPGTGAQ
jgi:hypothetical protein